MASGFWLNNDGLPLQFGPLKAQPEVAGDYLVYGETREVETLVAFVPYQLGTGGVAVPAIPTTFSGTGQPIAAGIQSMTTTFPMQTTAVNAGGTTITLLNPQLFIESVEVETLIGATGGTSFSLGFVSATGQLANGTASTFTQVSDGTNTSGHLLNSMPIAAFTTAGQKILYTKTGTFGFDYQVPGTLRAGGGFWIGNVPIVTTTRADGSLINEAFLSAIASGTFTNGLIKVRVRYNIYGNINY